MSRKSSTANIKHKATASAGKKRKPAPQVKGVSDIRRFFYRNEIPIFDEFGGNPSKTKLVALEGTVVRA